MSICDNCMNFPCTDDMSKLLKRCPAYEPIPKPPTNADRIRAMSDLELAKWLEGRTSVCFDPERDCRKDESCRVCLLKWLKSPVKGEE